MRTPDAGFTILEIVVALLVFSIGLLALTANVWVTTRMISEGERSTRMGLLAARELERILSRPCSAVTSGSWTEGPLRAVLHVSPGATAGSTQRLSLVVTATGPALPGRADTVDAVRLC